MEVSQKKINYLFSNSDLRKLIGPLIVEQLLLIVVGLVDSIMVASVGESAVSAVSLVDTIMVLVTQVFTALGTGGAVVAGQFLGQKNEKKSCEASDQLMLFLLVSSIGVMILGYLLKYFILHKVFGTLEADVMGFANIYLLIVFLSIPAIAIYNGAAALFRAMGNSKVTMKISILMNSVNFVGNAILIYGLKMGVVGAAIPTVFSTLLGVVLNSFAIFGYNSFVTAPNSSTLFITIFIASLKYKYPFIWAGTPISWIILVISASKFPALDFWFSLLLVICTSEACLLDVLDWDAAALFKTSSLILFINITKSNGFTI